MPAVAEFAKIQTGRDCPGCGVRRVFEAYSLRLVGLADSTHPTLDDAVEWAAGGGECIDAARDLRVFDERRGVVGFEAGVDHERAAAPPVFVFDEGVDAVDVGGGVGAGERDPEEVAERLGDELAVVDDGDKAEGGGRKAEGGRELRIADCGLRIGVLRAFDWRGCRVRQRGGS